MNVNNEKLNTSTLKEKKGEEVHQHCSLMIAGINIFLPRIPTKFSACVAHEEVMQEASTTEAIGPNVFKTNNFCVTAGVEEG
jgi:hypothetical protein